MTQKGKIRRVQQIDETVQDRHEARLRDARRGWDTLTSGRQLDCRATSEISQLVRPRDYLERTKEVFREDLSWRMSSLHGRDDIFPPFLAESFGSPIQDDWCIGLGQEQ
jgi:hypothetical protein